MKLIMIGHCTKEVTKFYFKLGFLRCLDVLGSNFENKSSELLFYTNFENEKDFTLNN